MADHASDRPRAVTPEHADHGPAQHAGADPAGWTAAEQTGEHRATGAQRTGAEDVLKAEFGGMRFLLAFLGWLAATGAVVLLTAILTGVLTAIGVQSGGPDAQDSGALRTAGVLGITALAFVLFVGYYLGGYVAGRMARFSGLKQGFAVWLWAVIVAVLAAIATAIAGSTTDAFARLSDIGLPVDSSTLTVTGIASLLVAIVFSLLGALLGGLAGMRFHRRVDRFAREH